MMKRQNQQQQGTQITTPEAFNHLEVLMEKEEAFFPATEVAKLLGYKNPQKALRDHCLNKGCVIRSVNTNAGKRQKKYISEGNLYRLIVRSKLPQAVEFERWIFDDVLPNLRSEGVYLPQSTAEEAINNPEAFLARALIIAQKQIKAYTSANRKMTS